MEEGARGWSEGWGACVRTPACGPLLGTLPGTCCYHYNSPDLNHIHAHSYMYVCIFVPSCMSVYVSVYVFMCMCIYNVLVQRIYACIYVCIHVLYKNLIFPIHDLIIFMIFVYLIYCIRAQIY